MEPELWGLVLLAAASRGNEEEEEGFGPWLSLDRWVQPIAHWHCLVLPLLNFIVSGTHSWSLVGEVISCVALPLKASSQGNQGSVSHPSTPALIITFSPFLCSLNCVPPFCISWPRASVSAPPPLCLYAATAVSSAACLGRSPAVLPGHPPWLPLCGSELAPPPAPPRARTPLIRL